MKRLTILILLLTSLVISCSDPCNDINCLNGGICLEGTCDCPEGYIGATCATEYRTALLGSWTKTTISCDEDPYEDDSTIIEIDPDNILGLIITIDEGRFYTIIDTSGNLTIPSGNVVDVTDSEAIANISGSGTLTEAGGTIDVVVFELDDPDDTYNCQFTLSR